MCLFRLGGGRACGLPATLCALHVDVLRLATHLPYTRYLSLPTQGTYYYLHKVPITTYHFPLNIQFLPLTATHTPTCTYMYLHVHVHT